MTEVNAVQRQTLEAADNIGDFQIPAFGPAKTSLIAPLIAIADTMYNSIKVQEIGNAELSIGMNDEVQALSNEKKQTVAILEAQLIAEYNDTPKRSSYSNDHDGEVAYHNALSQHQAEMQKLQAKIQALKSEDDAATSSAQSVAGGVSNEMATILQNSDTEYEMGKSILNDPVSTVANMIASLGAPQN